MATVTFTQTKDVVQKQIASVLQLIKKHDLDGLYISSADPYLNEYVPLENCFRYYLTQFSGSTADVIVLSNGTIRLYVDGRYYEQADAEVDANLVDVVKVPFHLGLTGAMIDDIAEFKVGKIGVVGERTPLELAQKFKQHCKVVNIHEAEFKTCLDLKPLPLSGPIFRISHGAGDYPTQEKLDKCLNSENEAFFITALDSIAWATNCRGYHLPFMSTFYARALLTKECVHVFVHKDIALDTSTKNLPNVRFHSYDQDYKTSFNSIIDSLNITSLKYDAQSLSLGDYDILKHKVGEDKLHHVAGGISIHHALKDSREIVEIKRSFASADQAIAKTIRWVKSSMANGANISERDLYDQTNLFYRHEGAKEQSFNTISGVGKNGSIVHYGGASREVPITAADMILLDSGGYFEGGFATDTTRTFLAGTKTDDPVFKEIYTLVLKGLLNCLHAVFPAGVTGGHLDFAARSPLYQAGYNYNHGTGHGVGIHVHEPGARIGPNSTVPMRAGQLVSIEPGIYIPGKGGVRLENIALVVPHAQYEGFLTFESVVYVGFDHALIDMDRLTEVEKKWLADYEEICARRGTLLN